MDKKNRDSSAMIAIDKVFFVFRCGRSGRPHPYTTMHHSGVVMRESTVETATHLLAKAESPPYFSARTAVTPPMGMAANTTETPVTRLSAPQSLQPSSTAAGISPSRMRQ